MLRTFNQYQNEQTETSSKSQSKQTKKQKKLKIEAELEIDTSQMSKEEIRKLNNRISAKKSRVKAKENKLENEQIFKNKEFTNKNLKEDAIIKQTKKQELLDFLANNIGIAMNVIKQTEMPETLRKDLFERCENLSINESNSSYHSREVESEPQEPVFYPTSEFNVPSFVVPNETLFDEAEEQYDQDVKSPVQATTSENTIYFNNFNTNPYDFQQLIQPACEYPNCDYNFHQQFMFEQQNCSFIPNQENFDQEFVESNFDRSSDMVFNDETFVLFEQSGMSEFRNGNEGDHNRWEAFSSQTSPECFNSPPYSNEYAELKRNDNQIGLDLNSAWSLSRLTTQISQIQIDKASENILNSIPEETFDALINNS